MCSTLLPFFCLLLSLVVCVVVFYFLAYICRKEVLWHKHLCSLRENKERKNTENVGRKQNTYPCKNALTHTHCLVCSKGTFTKRKNMRNNGDIDEKKRTKKMNKKKLNDVDNTIMIMRIIIMKMLIMRL